MSEGKIKIVQLNSEEIKPNKEQIKYAKKLFDILDTKKIGFISSKNCDFSLLSEEMLEISLIIFEKTKNAIDFETFCKILNNKKLFPQLLKSFENIEANKIPSPMKNSIKAEDINRKPTEIYQKIENHLNNLEKMAVKNNQQPTFLTKKYRELLEK